MPAPVGPYSPLVLAGPLAVCSGQLGLRPGASGPELVPGGTGPEATQALANVAEVLAEAGLGWEDVVKVTVFLTDMADYQELNRRYAEALGSARPARTVVAVAGLPLGAKVEVEVWARLPQDPADPKR
ncbi:RidA family protein [Aciditerrimonas ferrireducens]|uniref:RidA family protein n=1 Tax=Aciditerrimonas ferrireducens TaxID=667306 RepID=UPI002005D71B|nr:Rid family hydrolase [Aciditerrimonas ferrireducens]MCK4176807.1 deaminase [Aciditerrimonas ferrireducens]